MLFEFYILKSLLSFNCRLLLVTAFAHYNVLIQPVVAIYLFAILSWIASLFVIYFFYLLCEH